MLGFKQKTSEGQRSMDYGTPLPGLRIFNENWGSIC
jgi:hypothetical protein